MVYHHISRVLGYKGRQCNCIDHLVQIGLAPIFVSGTAEP